MGIITLRRRAAVWSEGGREGGDHVGFADRIPRSAILPLTPSRRTYYSNERARSPGDITVYSNVIRGIMPVLHV